MHLVVAPASLIELAIVRFEYSLALTYPLSMLPLVFIPSKVKGEAKAVSRALVEHPLVAKPVLEKHVTYAMHLALRVDLPIVYIAVIDTLDPIDPLDFIYYYWMSYI
jgi:hypothetical protein